MFVATIFTFWVLFLGGAEILEGTIISAFLIQNRAPFWSSTGIKIYVVFGWLGYLLRHSLI
jgi:hypothetical protein